ncbi:MAG: M14 family zinc carboxypeptidase [Actinomycetota bacterium]
MRSLKTLALVATTAGLLALPVSDATATPVCTDGYMGGPPRAACGGRVFPESAIARGYVQFTPDPAGFAEYQHGVEYLAELYPRWISVFTLREYYKDRDAVSSGDDQVRSYDEEDRDLGDGRDIFVVKITDHKAPDKGKKPLFFSLSVHGNERGGLEGGLRTAEDLAIAAEEGGTINDGVENYETTTGTNPKFHEYEVKDVLKKEVVYLASFNPDGWAVGDTTRVPTAPYERGNSMGTDLNRQMPTVGRVNENRNPLQESEMNYGLKLMREVARIAGGLMAYGADVHGELTSNAYVDIMYPAGEFDSREHRTLMAIAERTKSNIDATLYQGIQDQIEEATGGNSGEGPDPSSNIPTKPAHWATVWDTLGYTDTGFIGDYLATDLAVTGMDYEIFLNHTVPDKTWNVYLQENHINATRQIIKTAMAYALFQEKEFKGFELNTRGRAGYLTGSPPVTDRDGDGPGTLPGPGQDGIGENGKKVRQAHYRVSNLKWFKDTSKVMTKPFAKVGANDVARGTKSFKSLDTLVLADYAKMPKARGAKMKRYFKGLRSWVQGGGNLVLTDRSLHALAGMGLVEDSAIQDIEVYQPYTDIQDFEHPMVEGLRPNARQLVETPPLGYCIGNTCSPMTTVDETAFTDANGHVVGTSGDGLVSVGELTLGKGLVRIVGGALPTPTEKHDHRYGLRNYAMTYTGLYIMENSVTYSRSSTGARGKPLI